MVESGNWIIPEYNGYPRYQKPILFYWLQALAQSALGPTAWAARLPSAGAGTLLVLLVAALGNALWGRRAGLWSGIVLAVSVEIVLLSRMVMTDILLLLFVQSGLAAFYLAQLVPPAARRPWYLLMHAALALGLLTKGPIAFVLPGAILGPWLLARGELLATLREMRLGWGLGMVALIAGPWYFLAHVFSAGEFTWEFFVTENVGRFTANVNPHDAPPFLYFLVIVPLTFPWAGLLPQAIRSSLRGPLRSAPFREAAPWLLTWQIMLVLGLFTLSGTRVWTYTLPIMPPLALLVGRWLARQLSSPHGSQRAPLRWPLWGFAVIAFGLMVCSWGLPAHRLPVEVRTETFVGCCRLLAGLLWLLSLIVLLLDHLAPLRVVLTTLVGGVVGFYLTVAWVGVPLADRLLKGPVREAATLIREHEADVIVTYMVHELSLNRHTSRRRVFHWREGSQKQIELLLNSETKVFVLVSPEYLAEFAHQPCFIWSRSPRFVLIANFPRGLSTEEPQPGMVVFQGPGE